MGFKESNFGFFNKPKAEKGTCYYATASNIQHCPPKHYTEAMAVK